MTCVVFDFDGVLVDSNAVKRQAYFTIFEPLGAGATRTVEAVLRSDVESDRFQLIAEVLRRLGADGTLRPDQPADTAVAWYATRYNDICESYAATCAEVPGAAAAIEQLSPTHALFINSATPEEPLRRIVDRRGWSPRFRGVYGRPRSKVENLGRAMALERLTAAAVVFVGDGRRDLEAARAVGCRFIGVRNAFNDFDPAGEVMVDDLRALPDLIAPAGTSRRATAG